MGKYELFLSRREEEVLNALGKFNQNKNIAHQSLKNREGEQLSQSAVRSHMTRVFQRYVQALEVMAEYYDIFDRRWNKHEKRITKLRREIGKRRRMR